MESLAPWLIGSQCSTTRYVKLQTTGTVPQPQRAHTVARRAGRSAAQSHVRLLLFLQCWRKMSRIVSGHSQHNQHTVPSSSTNRYLDLRHNKLTGLPRSVCLHPQLRTLLLGNNCIAALPALLGQGPSPLKSVNLAGNPLYYPSPEVIAQVGANTARRPV